MDILNSVFKQLVCSLPCPPPERGGILGGQDGVISTYAIDDGLQGFDCYAQYYPNVKKLNEIIRNWEKQHIVFYGIFHSHFPGGNQLSLGDERYIRQIMMAMPTEVNTLFFPLVIQTSMVGYRADRCGPQIRICCDDIKII